MGQKTRSQQAFEVIRMVHIIGHQTDEVLDALLQKEFNLTLSRFRILMPLIELGPQTQAEIARFHFITEASVARQVQLLISDGYLKRVVDPADARKFILMFTPETEQLLLRVKSRLGVEINLMYQRLSLSQLKTLETLLAEMQKLGAAKTHTPFVEGQIK